MRRTKILTQDGQPVRRSQLRGAKAATRRGDKPSLVPKTMSRRAVGRGLAKKGASASKRREV